SFIECRDSPQRKALVHLFFAEREARRIPGLGPEVTALPVHRAAVVGAGTMGGGIAMTLANAGIPVSLLELSAQALERGLGVVGKSYDASVARGSLTRSQADAALGLIRGVSEYPALAGADIVIEAVYEDLEVKQEVFGRLDRVAGPHAILATNTSTLDIDAIAASTTRPEKVVGTHFFSPANVMRLLENVRGRHTSPETVATVMALAKRLGKIAVLAGNCDGFIGNRMLMFYGAEAEFLLEEGATPEQIDRVIEGLGIGRRSISDEEILERLLHPLVNEGARIVEEGIALRSSDIDIVYVNGYGFPAWRGGPMYWAEEAGLERVIATMRRLAPRRGARWRPAPLLERLVASGRGLSSGLA